MLQIRATLKDYCFDLGCSAFKNLFRLISDRWKVTLAGRVGTQINMAQTTQLSICAKISTKEQVSWMGDSPSIFGPFNPHYAWFGGSLGAAPKRLGVTSEECSCNYQPCLGSEHGKVVDFIYVTHPGVLANRLLLSQKQGEAGPFQIDTICLIFLTFGGSDVPHPAFDGSRLDPQVFRCSPTSSFTLV